MATFNPQDITTSITSTTKFSEYRNKIQESLDQFGGHVNDELTALYASIATDPAVTYTQAEIEARDQAIRDEMAGAVGNISKPILDLDLSRSLDYEVGEGTATFERSTTATYIDKYGVLQYADIDEPRFEKDGLLIEGGSTNMCLKSTNPVNDEAEWTKSASDGTSVSTTQMGSDGTNYAFEFYDNTTTSVHYLAQKILWDDNSAGTFQIKLKAGDKNWVKVQLTGKDSLLYSAFFNLSNGTIGATTPNTIAGVSEKLHNGFYLCSISIDDVGVGIEEKDVKVFSAVADGTAVYTGVGGTVAQFYYEHPQVEELPFATSYIPTTASAVARGADRVKVGFANNVPYSYQNQSILARFKTLGSLRGTNLQGEAQGVFGIEGAFYRYSRMYGDDLINRYFNTSYIDINDLDMSINHTVVNTYDDGIVASYLDGVQNASFNLGIPNVLEDTSSIFLWIGKVGHTDQYLYGHISSLKTWDKALTSTEVALLAGGN
jgi:hypothetical protein